MGGGPIDPYFLSPRTVAPWTELVTSWAVLVSFGEARTFFAGEDPDSCLVLPASSGSMMASIGLLLVQIVGGKKKKLPKVEGNLPLLTLLLARALFVLSPIDPC